MKFLPSEHNAFKTLIDKSTLSYDTFSFVKKKGWLNISQEIMPDSFRFHRKDESGLDSKGKWVKSSSYSVNIGTEVMGIGTFEKVLLAFESWLTEAD